MALQRGSEYLDHGFPDESDLEEGYDSEAAERSKGGRASVQARSVKRRKLSLEDGDNGGDSDADANLDLRSRSRKSNIKSVSHSKREDEQVNGSPGATKIERSPDHSAHIGETPRAHLPNEKSQDNKVKHKESKPGVVYLSSVPPYLKPSALRNLLLQRGFSPITRLFLTPASKAKAGSKKNSRQLYSEGWIEFASKKTAKRCAEELNTQIVGGRKGGFYHDDLWNMKYLRGMSWNELMAGIREEKREEEGRRDEERRIIARQTKMFVEGVEQGKRLEGMKRKRRQKNRDAGTADDAGNNNEGNSTTRTWRQFEVKSKDTNDSIDGKEAQFSEDVKGVLAKIF